MAFQDQQPGDIRATLAVSQEEARFGSSRVVNLPGGRTMTVVVPAGTRDGQEIRLAGQGSGGGARGVAGDLILRVAVIASGSFQRANEDYATERALYPSAQNSASSGYAGGERGPGWSASAQPAPGPSFASTPNDAVRSGSPIPPQPYPGSGGYQSNPPYGQMAPISQPYPNSGGYQRNPAYDQMLPPQNYPPQEVQPPKPRRSGAITALILVIVLVLIAGSGLIYYLGYYQPNQVHTVATQTAYARTTATAHIAATGTAQIVQATANASATSAAQAQATAQVYQNIYTQATSGTPLWNDPLSSPTLNPLWNITIGNTANGACSFTGGSYHSTIPQVGYFQPCYALNTNYSNFAFQVDITITQGDFGGVLLRANSAHNKFYLFRVGMDDSFAVYNYATNQGSQAALLLTGSSKSMKALNQSNEITVVARHAAMYFYLNRQYLGSTNDNTYTTGQIGVFAESAKNPTDVAFSNAKLWTL